MSGGTEEGAASYLEEMDEDELLQLEGNWAAVEAEGELKTCASANYAWYTEAEKDLADFMNSLEKELQKEEEEAQKREDKENLPDPAALGQNRSASYGDGWEDDPLEDWQPEAILKRQKYKGIVYYLVKWRHRDETTWETEEDLEEEGHGRMLQESRKVSEVRTVRKKNHPFDPTSYWPDYLDRIEKAFYQSSSRVLEVHNVLTTERAQAFSNRWEPGMVPTMLFHGTNATAIGSIIDNGLRIPRNRSDIVNGSAHGVGIYTGVMPSISMGYVRNCTHLFVCAGLVEGKFESTVKNLGQMCVFFKECQVIPCFLVKYEFDYEVRLSPPKAPSQLRCSPFNIDEFEKAFVPQGLREEVRQIMGNAYKKYIRSGSDEPGARYDRSNKTLTKKQLKAMPRSAKEAYKSGLLKQKKSLK